MPGSNGITCFPQVCLTLRKERRDLYPQGVASGDPAPDSVILWTRRIPDAGARAYRLEVEVASDPAFAHIVARGDVEVSAATDWTCRFLAAGLQADREYWYRFVDEAGNTSRVGRTLTAPEVTDARPVRFAFVSCQDLSRHPPCATVACGRATAVAPGDRRRRCVPRGLRNESAEHAFSRDAMNEVCFAGAASAATLLV